jgi:hypothetical protein
MLASVSKCLKPSTFHKQDYTVPVSHQRKTCCKEALRTRANLGQMQRHNESQLVHVEIMLRMSPKFGNHQIETLLLIFSGPLLSI